MRLYLLRHGIAEEKSASGRDRDRELTGKGRTELKRVLEVASHAKVEPSLILTSPYARARETAAIARKALGTGEDLVETKALVPEGEPQSVWAEICDHRKEESLMLVGHNPLLEQMVAHLLGTPTLRFQFEKAAIVAIEIGNFRGEPDGVLLWVLTPAFAKD